MPSPGTEVWLVQERTHSDKDNQAGVTTLMCVPLETGGNTGFCLVYIFNNRKYLLLFCIMKE